MTHTSRNFAMTFRASEREHVLVYTRRDMTVLRSAHLPEGEAFKIAVGVWDNFTVAGGQNTNAWTSRPRLDVLVATRNLLDAVVRDRELLGRDYSYKLPWRAGWSMAGESGFSFAGKKGSIRGGAGQLVIRLLDVGSDGRGTDAGKIDLRPEGVYKPDDGGEIKIRRKVAPFTLPNVLPEILAFIRATETPDVQIRHHYAE
jgi:hypothetical protein